MPTDKLLGPPRGHNYIAIYNSLNLNPNKVLEIGTLYGDSMRLWREMWPNAELHGIDNCDEELDKDFITKWTYGENKEWHFYQGDAYNENTINIIDFDLIIDDGPHTIESQCFTAKHWSTRLNSGGVLVIEDLESFDNACIVAKELPINMQNTAFIATTDGISSVALKSSIMLISRNE